jgi:hypothetical protein
LKNGLKKKFGKRKEKTTKPARLLSAQAAHQPIKPSPRQPTPPPPFFFSFPFTDGWDPLVSFPFLPHPPFLPLHGGAAADPAAPARLPLLPLPIKTVNQVPEHQGLVTPLILISFL